MIRALITDLDNTLYDWVTFFALSFDAMVTELTRVLDVDRQSLLSRLRPWPVLSNGEWSSSVTPKLSR